MKDVTWTSERTVMRSFDGEIADANARALALRDVVTGFAGVEDAIPGARTLTVVLRPGLDPSDELLRALEGEVVPRARDDVTEHEVVVTYDGEDLEAVADAAGMHPNDVARLHAAATYTVAFIGFAPGFPYLIGLPMALVTQRRATPRARVPAGSVAIAGAFSGIYPRATPGGWNLIGRTAAVLFDARRGATMRPGDRVRFVS